MFSNWKSSPNRGENKKYLKFHHLVSFISRFHSIFNLQRTSQPSGQPPGGHRSGLPALPNNMDLKKSWRRGPGDDDDDDDDEDDDDDDDDDDAMMMMMMMMMQ